MSLPSEARIVELASYLSELCGRLNAELGPPGLVLPNAAHFPDPFTQDARSVQRLLDRLKQHAHIGDIPVEAVLYADEAEASSCSSGACAPKTLGDTPGRLTLGDANDPTREGQWQVHLMRAEITHATALTTLLSRSLAQVFLEEVRGDNSRGVPQAPELVELTAVRLGFGVLLLEGSHVYSKGCGGPQIHKLTRLDSAELAIAVALLGHAFGLRLKDAYRHLSTTQHSLLTEADALIGDNRQLADWVRNGKPGNSFKLAAPRPRLLSWLLPKPKASDDALAEAFLNGGLDEKLLQQAAPTRPLPTTAGKARLVDPELRELVEEALNSR